MTDRSLGDHVKGFLSTLSSSHSNSNSPAPPYNGGYAQPPMQQQPPYPDQQYGGQQYQQDWQSQNGPPSYYGQPPPQQWPPANQYPQQHNGPQQYGGPQQHGYQQGPPQGPYNQHPSNGFPPQPQQQQQQQQGYGQGPPGTPMSLQVRAAGDRVYYVVDSNTGQTVYTFNFGFKSSGSGPVHVMRGDNGPPCGTLTYHSFSSKVDMNLGNSFVKFKKEFPSNTGLGYLTWQKNGGSCFSSGGNLILESGGSVLATYRLEKGPGSQKRQGGGIEIQKPGLSQAQLDEVVISGVAELERLRLAAGSSSAGSSAGVIAAIT
ncbi:hypothetical protein CEP54_010646 [Fusarium duplospermum]|uniref:Uncharacterized protein n=1 Tax=Fusarium duplospermum TaxID=1325734 RepID=A0A428PIX7_9HYPO|nr:hypothetical protein CEP54_010646 [Fusarium duplospermum]